MRNTWGNYRVPFQSILFFPLHDTTEPSGPGDLYYWDFTNTLRHITLDRTPTDEWSARHRDLNLTTHNRQTSMSPAIFEPAIPASERPKNHALDRAANGIGFQSIYVLVNFLYVFAWKCTRAIRGLSRCWRLGPSGLCHRVVLVVNRRFKETHSLHFRVPLPLTLKMEATVYSETGGIHLKDNNLSKPKTPQSQHSASWKAELLRRSRWRVIWSRFESGTFRTRVGSTSLHQVYIISHFQNVFRSRFTLRRGFRPYSCYICRLIRTQPDYRHSCGFPGSGVK
jgi:hypothetical protein